ncbi:hypothetical protein EDC56_2720 [Sinobacterium caligoides]|uniref:Uncharacterized protein n=1 Tax=Sinobacterium caligoides TaxID=933926 RepID=A0A3N2DJV0_9GAMM|nr:hypothetical protein EDC56_2720 [Sinobacterium caligoides]
MYIDETIVAGILVVAATTLITGFILHMIVKDVRNSRSD